MVTVFGSMQNYRQVRLWYSDLPEGKPANCGGIPGGGNNGRFR